MMNKCKHFVSLALCFSLILSPTAAYAAPSTTANPLVPSDGISQGLAPSNVSINVKDADVRDVLSAVAVNMGYNIIYKGDVAPITIKIDNQPPEKAFDYLLKILNLSYLQDGDTLIVGTKETLTRDFKQTLSLSGFELVYVTADVIAAQLVQLGIPVTVIKLDSNPYSLCVQGFPSDVAKVGELIEIMDVFENESELPPGADATKKTVSRILLDHITAAQFNKFLKAVGINCGLFLNDEEDTLFIYATPEERNSIQAIRSKVDHTIVDEWDDMDGVYFDGTTFDILSTTKVSKNTIVSAISKIIPDLQIISVDNKTNSFLVVGLNDDIERARLLIEDLDKTLDNSGLDTSFYSYTFKNLTAEEAEKRLTNVVFGDTVTWYTTPYPQFAYTMFFYCNPDYYPIVEALLNKIDGALAKTIRLPIYSANESSVLNSLVTALITLLPNANLTQTDFAVINAGITNILYVTATPDIAKSVEDMAAALDDAPSNDDDQKYSVDVYIAEMKAIDPKFNGDIKNWTSADWELYGVWYKLKTKDGKSIGGASIGGASIDGGVLPTPALPGQSSEQPLLSGALSALTKHFENYPIVLTGDAEAEAQQNAVLKELQSFLSNSDEYKTITAKDVKYFYTLANDTTNGSFTINFTLTDSISNLENCSVEMVLPTPDVQALRGAGALLGKHFSTYSLPTTASVTTETEAADVAQKIVMQTANQVLSDNTAYYKVKADYSHHAFTPATATDTGLLQVEIVLSKDGKTLNWSIPVTLKKIVEKSEPAPNKKPDAKPITPTSA